MLTRRENGDGTVGLRLLDDDGNEILTVIMHDRTAQSLLCDHLIKWEDERTKTRPAAKVLSIVPRGA